ncbi:MAG TPA: glycosyltransferase family 39 protein, partial [Candidatus Saccharimonadales bacterium]|nr:glycosyltransferase family 39 protein [Candidatus Saccharimonadales bacterium]
RIFDISTPDASLPGGGEPRGPGRAVGGAIALLVAARLGLILSGVFILAPDEAYFWEWSRHPAFGYYDQGPAVAWVIRLFTLLFGATELGVRGGAAFVDGLTLLLVATLVRRLGGSRRASLLAVLAMALTPLGQVNAFLMTYYVPQMLLWTLVVLTLWELRDSGGTARSWLALGLWLGLGGLTHHTFLWLGILALAWLLWTPETRRAFAGPWPWAAAAVAAVVVSPYAIWNAGHDWVGVRHAAALVHLAQPSWRGVGWSGVLYYVAGQFAVFTPFYLAAGLWAIAGETREALRGSARGRLLALATWPLFVYVATLAWAGRSEANWTSAATLAVAAAWALRQDRAWRARGRMPLTVPLCLTTALLVTAALTGTPLLWRAGLRFRDPSHDPTHRLHGWRQLGLAAYALRESLSVEGPTVTATVDDYAIPAELSFYAPDHAMTYCPPLGRRHHQYDFWPSAAPPLGGNAVWVTRYEIPAGAPVRSLFRTWDPARAVDVVEPSSGVLRRRFYLYPCRGFTGPPPDRVRGY